MPQRKIHRPPAVASRTCRRSRVVRRARRYSHRCRPHLDVPILTKRAPALIGNSLGGQPLAATTDNVFYIERLGFASGALSFRLAERIAEFFQFSAVFGEVGQ